MSGHSGVDAVAASALERTTSRKSDASGQHGTIITNADAMVADPIQEDLPTEQEMRTLRRVSDKFPMSAWLVAIVEFAERFSYYGTAVAYSNYIRAPLPPGSTTGAVPKGHRSSGIAGALGRGQEAAFALTTFNTFWIYITPIPAAIIADTWLGRYKTIWWSTGICLIGHIILVCSSIPSSLQHPSGALAACAISIVIIGIGGGGIKSNVSPLIAEQYTGHMRKQTQKNGEVVIVDPGKTYERLYLMFYWMINLGALCQIATSFITRDVGYWLAYALPTWVFLLIPIVLILGRNVYVRTPPRGSILLETFRVVRVAMRGQWSINPSQFIKNVRRPGFWDPAKPSYYQSGETGEPMPTAITWDDMFVEEVRRALKACAVFAYYPIYWLCYNQINNNLITQTAGMTLDGTPNDLVSNLDPIVLVVFIPIFDRVVYPTLAYFKIKFTPLRRITAGFIVVSFAMAYAAGIQHCIYSKSPCGGYASSCTHPDGTPWPAPINVWVSGPIFMLVAISEIFTSATGLEYAFSKAPARMKSVITAMFLFSNSVSSAIGFALTDVTADPDFVWLYGSFAVAAFVFGIMFWFTFRNVDREEDHLNLIGMGRRDGFVDEQKPSEFPEKSG